ncbi:eL39 family ribosomal protein, partial [Salmonella sp. s54925]|uniref:eL39 family ribosomal protein n=1 Tax=Salmonella sp. s54925 TaxID=3159674 RepID=UPI003980EF66
MPSHKSFKIKRKLARKMKQNRPIPQWVRLRTGNSIRYNAKRPFNTLAKCTLYVELFCYHGVSLILNRARFRILNQNAGLLNSITGRSLRSN